MVNPVRNMVFVNINFMKWQRSKDTGLIFCKTEKII